jgi:flagellar hook assembly protein FlgD
MKRSFAVCVLALVPLTASAQPVLRAYAGAGATTVFVLWSGSPTSAVNLYRATQYPNWQPPVRVNSGTIWSESVGANFAAVYQIQPVDGAGNPVGPPSNIALLTTAAFTDDPLAIGVTVKAQHVTELRTAVNLVRAAAGLTAYSWTYSISGQAVIHAADVAELRTALNGALTNLNLLPLQPFVDPTLDNTVTIKRDHIQQLRNRVRNFPETVGVSASVTNRYFSPNGDGSKDTTQFNATVTSAGSYAAPVFRWILNVKNAGGTVVRSTSGVGTSIAYVWDGRNGSGAIQPDGDYTFDLVDLDGISVAVVSAVTTIDLTAPAVSITSPTAGQTFSNIRQNGSGNVAITGTATDAHFTSWTLSVDNVTSSLATGTGTSVSATWNSLPLANGTYTIRLVGLDQAGNTGTTTVSIVVGHFSASQNVFQINTASSETVTYTSVVPFTVTEVLTIKSDATTNVVRTLVNASRAAGTYTDTWNGSSDAAAPLPDGTYRYYVTVTDPSTGSSLTWDQSNQYYGSEITQYPYPKCVSNNALVDCSDSSIHFDPYSNQPMKIVYCVGGGTPTSETTCSGTTATSPYFVGVKMSSTPETSALCDNCAAFSYQAPGAHEEVWYGRSFDGLYDLASVYPYMTVIRRNDIWPKNRTLLYGTAPKITAVSFAPLIFNPAAATPAGQAYQVSLSSPVSRSIGVTAQFRNVASNSILRTITTALSTAAQQSINWDGRADNGDWVAPGLYEVIITATDSAGSKSVIRPLTTVRY